MIIPFFNGDSTLKSILRFLPVTCDEGLVYLVFIGVNVQKLRRQIKGRFGKNKYDGFLTFMSTYWVHQLVTFVVVFPCTTKANGKMGNTKTLRVRVFPRGVRPRR